jgi:biofilm PGA synthesis lipoprotein PgaB
MNYRWGLMFEYARINVSYHKVSTAWWVLFILIFLKGLLVANDAPHPCSRDRNINEFTILSYHEIAKSTETLDAWYAVNPKNFEDQIVWLINHDFHFISVDDILNYRNKGKPLPEKAVLITFDDGYHSVYANAFPILKKYKIPSVIALVGSWLFDQESIKFDQQAISRKNFLSQSEIKEMVGSGLVEIASHSYLYHKGIMGNPQENMQPAITTRQWLKDKNRYEDEKSYKKRVYEDLLANNLYFDLELNTLKPETVKTSILKTLILNSLTE